MRIKSADLKNKFLFLSFAAFRASLVYGKAADCHMLLRIIGEIKVSRDRFRYVFVATSDDLLVLVVFMMFLFDLLV